MIEPISLSEVKSIKDVNLRTALKKMYSGEALVCSFTSPCALFFGYIPRQMSVVWKYPNEDKLYVQKNGYTYFTWSHSCEFFVVTGLVSHTYKIGSINVSITFHIFDPVKFTKLTTVELFNEKIEIFLGDMFKGKQEDEFQKPSFYKYMAEKFTEANQIFQPLGVSINAIDPPGFNE